jgi:hypothetical protein
MRNLFLGTRRWRTLHTTLVLLSIALLFPVAGSASEAAAAGGARLDSQAAGGRLVGTWEFQVSFVDCETGTPLAPPFTSLHTYLPGGSALEQGSRVGAPATSRTVGQGVWEREGAGLFRGLFVFFAFDATGQTLGRVEINELVELDGRDRSLHYGFANIFTPDGVQVARNCFTGPGERVKLTE